MRMAIVCVALIMAGCSTPPPAPEIDCSKVHVVDYPADFEQKIVDEIKAAPPAAAWPSAIADYRAMRLALAACQEATAAVTH
jgi:hypothetical protein